MTALARHRFALFVLLSLVCSAALALLTFLKIIPTSGEPWPAGIFWLPAILGVWLLCFVFGCWPATHGAESGPSVRTILVGLLLVAIPLMMVQPLSSTDLYANAYYGRLVSVHHLNPYSITPATRLSDVYFQKTQAATPFQTTYGPLWVSVAATVTSVSGLHIQTTVFLFRLLNLLALAAIVLVLNTLLRGRLGASWLVATVALNPLVLFEGINNGHNDLFMMLFVVCAIAAYLRHRDGFVLPLLCLGGLIKFVPWLLIPIAAIALWQRPVPAIQRLRTIGLGLAIGLGLIVLAFIPYWHGAATFHELQQLGQFYALPFFHPIAWVHWFLLRFGLSESAATQHAHTVGIIVFAFAVLGILWGMIRRRLDFTSAAVLTLAAFFLFGIIYVQPWYLLWIVPLAPLLTGRLRALALLGATILPLAAYSLFLA